MSTNERWVVGPGETRSTRDQTRRGDADAAKLEADIARTRREMSGTIDEIQRRLDPERVKAQVTEIADSAKSAVREATIGRVEEKIEEMKENVREFRGGLMDTIRENPLPAALAAVGIGWLFMNGSGRSSSYGYGQARGAYPYGGYQAGRYRPEESRRGWVGTVGNAAGRFGDRAGDTVGDVQDQAAHVAGRVQQRAGEVAGQVQNRAGEMAGQVQEAAGGMAEQAGNVVSSAQFEAMRTRYRVENMMRSNPLAAGAVALAAGVVVGMALPETEPEHRFMGEARDNLMERAGEVAQQAVEKVSQVASVATDAAKTEMSGGKPETSTSSSSSMAS